MTQLNDLEERARSLLQAAADTVDVAPGVDAVVRQRPRWPFVAAAASVVVAGLISWPVLLWESREEPSHPPPPAPSSSQPRTGPVDLATLALDDGRRIDLVALTGGESSCVEIRGVDERIRSCVPPPSEREPVVTAAISAWAIAQRNDSSPFEIYGTTSADVASVVVRHSGSEQEANLLRVTDLEALAQAGITAPFGLFFSELPARTTAGKVDVIAYDATGRRLGSDDFADFQDQPPRAMVGGPAGG